MRVASRVGIGVVVAIMGVGEDLLKSCSAPRNLPEKPGTKVGVGDSGVAVTTITTGVNVLAGVAVITMNTGRGASSTSEHAPSTIAIRHHTARNAFRVVCPIYRTFMLRGFVVPCHLRQNCQPGRVAPVSPAGMGSASIALSVADIDSSSR